MHADTQKLLDAAFGHAVKTYLHACEMAQALKEGDTEENRRHDNVAHERTAGVEELLGVLLDSLGYDVRMDLPVPVADRPEETTFIQWTLVEREIVKWGYAHGLIERDHMLAWFDHNQTNGWLRHRAVEIPA